MKQPTQAQQLLAIHLEELGFSEVLFEYCFCAHRKWRADIVATKQPRFYMFEIDGGVWIRGRHNRGKGFIADMEKINTAMMLGYRVLRFTPEQVLTGKAKAWLKEWL